MLPSVPLIFWPLCFCRPSVLFASGMAASKLLWLNPTVCASATNKSNILAIAPTFVSRMLPNLWLHLCVTDEWHKPILVQDCRVWSWVNTFENSFSKMSSPSVPFTIVARLSKFKEIALLQPSPFHLARLRATSFFLHHNFSTSIRCNRTRPIKGVHHLLHTCCIK